MENIITSMDEFDLDLDLDITDSATATKSAQEPKLMTQVCPITAWPCSA
ncbi:hypothetical protein ACFTZI_33420 [Streptomyces decoyicus]|nr:hypothetical protein [Streptomyces sp. NRRL S-1813]